MALQLETCKICGTLIKGNGHLQLDRYIRQHMSTNHQEQWQKYQEMEITYDMNRRIDYQELSKRAGELITNPLNLFRNIVEI